MGIGWARILVVGGGEGMLPPGVVWRWRGLVDEMCGGVALCIEGSMDVMAVAHGMIFVAAYPGVLARVLAKREMVSWNVSGICGRRDQLLRAAWYHDVGPFFASSIVTVCLSFKHHVVARLC